MEKKKQYKCLIFDADHTLLDYITDELSAFRRVYAKIGMPVTDTLLCDSRHFSEETWTEAGLYDVDDPRVQESYHRVYRSHVTGIFEKVFAKHGCPMNVNAEEAGKAFLKELEKGGQTLPFAEETLHTCALKYTLCIATNGLTEIQKGRLQRFAPMGRIFVSETLGTLKPLPQFFEKLLREVGFAPSECLMIGDSLKSDMAGAASVGMDRCWYNPTRQPNVSGVSVTYEIASLQELQTIV